MNGNSQGYTVKNYLICCYIFGVMAVSYDQGVDTFEKALSQGPIVLFLSLKGMFVVPFLSIIQFCIILIIDEFVYKLNKFSFGVLGSLMPLPLIVFYEEKHYTLMLFSFISCYIFKYLSIQNLKNKESEDEICQS